MAKESKPTLQKTADSIAQVAASAAEPQMTPPTLEVLNADSTQDARPTLEPPIVQSAGDQSAGASVWATQKVTGLWSINQDKNAWAYIKNEGWRKISPASESGLMALNMLAASARETQGNFQFRKESDNMIYEAYAW
jgi:hypothetical protein